MTFESILTEFGRILQTEHAVVGLPKQNLRLCLARVGNNAFRGRGQECHFHQWPGFCVQTLNNNELPKGTHISRRKGLKEKDNDWITSSIEF